jgi:tetratricopeptide (TPR) repeat protein
LILLALLELSLRLAGFGYPVDFLLPSSNGGEQTFVQNNQFGWRFFGSRMSRLPAPVSVARNKTPGVVRIFVFGESAAFGDPQPRFGLPRVLQVLLSLRHPGTRFEVVNAAMTGVNSHAILPIARACARAQGDVWVIYMGNNEVVGPFGAGTVFNSQVPPLPVIHLSLGVKATRTGQWLDRLREWAQPPPPGKSEWGGMTMFLDQQVRSSDPRMARVYANFDKNLSDILRVGKGSGVGIVVSTVAVNLKDSAPFASLHRAKLSAADQAAWDDFFQAGVAAEKGQDWVKARDSFQAAAQIDDTFAELKFRQGQCALALGQMSEARGEFISARDLDTLRFRCDSRMNDLIRRRTAHRESERILLADSEEALAAASRYGLPGAETFYEHVHLTFEGNYLLGRAIARQVERLLPENLNLPEDHSWPSIDDCARQLGHTDRDRQLALTEILGRLTDPPFVLQSDHETQMRRWTELSRSLRPADSPEALQLALAACEQALQAWSDDALLYQQLAELKQAKGDHTGAAGAAERSLQRLPDNQECWLLLGLALAQQGEFQKASVAFQRVFTLDPEDVWGRQNYAICLGKLGRRDEAIREFRRALILKPRFGLAWLGLGELYEEMNRPGQAEQCYQQAVANPIHRRDELVTLARFCRGRGWNESASTNYAEAIQLSPMEAGLRVEAGLCLVALGRHAEAAQQYAEATEISPDSGQAHFLYGLELGTLGRPGKAEQQFRDAIVLMPDIVEARVNLGIALSRQGKTDAAIAEFEDVLKRAPTNALALKYLQQLRIRAPQSSP